MHRIDTFGTSVSLPAAGDVGDVVGYFTEGNPVSATPATRVSAAWLNAVQEELLNVITAAGLTPTKGTNNQLLASLLGISQDYSEATFTVANNQSVAANVTNMVLNKANFKGAVIEFDLYRKDAVKERSVTGRMTLTHKTVLDAWVLSGPTIEGGDDDVDDIGVEFTVDAATGQVEYTSSNYAGGTYVGALRFKMSRFKQ
jgi:hypothetical protein